jgi:hypothetical protein
LSVRDTEHVQDVLRTLKRCPVVLKAGRINPA